MGREEELLVNRTDILTCPLCTGIAALNGFYLTRPCQRLSLPTQQWGTGCLCPAHNLLLAMSLAARSVLFHTVVDFMARRNY